MPWRKRVFGVCLVFLFLPQLLPADSLPADGLPGGDPLKGAVYQITAEELWMLELELDGLETKLSSQLLLAETLQRELNALEASWIEYEGAVQSDRSRLIRQRTLLLVLAGITTSLSIGLTAALLAGGGG